MKKNIFPLILLVLALCAAIGSLTFLSPCVHEDGSQGVCGSAGKALCAEGFLLAALALLMLPFSRAGVRLGLALACACVSATGMLLPGTVLPLCGMSAMRCRSLMQPAEMILFGLGMLVSILCAVREKRAMGKE